MFGRRERKGAARVEPDEQQAAPSLPDAVGNRLFWAAPLRCCLCLLPFRGSRGSVVYSYAIVVLRERVRLLVLAARNATASRHWARGVIHGPPVEAPPSLLPLPRCTCMRGECRCESLHRTRCRRHCGVPVWLHGIHEVISGHWLSRRRLRSQPKFVGPAPNSTLEHSRRLMLLNESRIQMASSAANSRAEGALRRVRASHAMLFGARHQCGFLQLRGCARKMT